MRSKVKALVFISLATFLFSGCVMKGAYDSKVQENQKLSQNLDETKNSFQALQDQHDKLAEENARQGEALKALSDEREDLKQQKAKLEEALKPENLIKTLTAFVAAQQQKIDELKAEIDTLKSVSPTEKEVAETPALEADSPVAIAPEASADVSGDVPAIEATAQTVTADTVDVSPAAEEVLDSPVEPAAETPTAEVTASPELQPAVPGN
jgi:predicted RNase H-like nuclease (RuvC/YqgF family)